MKILLGIFQLIVKSEYMLSILCMLHFRWKQHVTLSTMTNLHLNLMDIRRFMSMNRSIKIIIFMPNNNYNLFSCPLVQTYNKRVLGMTTFFEALAIVLTASILVNGLVLDLTGTPVGLGCMQ